MLLTCRSSVSVLLRVYMKNFLVWSIIILYWQTMSHAERGKSWRGLGLAGIQPQCRAFSGAPILAGIGVGGNSAPVSRLRRDRISGGNSDFEFWRYLLDEVRMYFELNPDDQ